MSQNKLLETLNALVSDKPPPRTERVVFKPSEEQREMQLGFAREGRLYTTLVQLPEEPAAATNESSKFNITTPCECILNPSNYTLKQLRLHNLQELGIVSIALPKEATKQLHLANTELKIIPKTNDLPWDTITTNTPLEEATKIKKEFIEYIKDFRESEGYDLTIDPVHDERKTQEAELLKSRLQVDLLKKQIEELQTIVHTQNTPPTPKEKNPVHIPRPVR